MLFLQRILVEALALFMSLGAIFQNEPVDSTALYRKNVASVGEYTNGLETAAPQTKVYDLINEHFKAPLACGKTRKKAIVIGYDGCRADALTLLDDEGKGAVSRMLSNGGTVELSYAGGVNYPEFPSQHTSTGPGWCSMLTGKWGTETGVTDNGMVKPVGYKTNLVSLIEDGVIDSSAFYVSWDGHFIEENSTYRAEMEYARERVPSAKFADSPGDVETVANVIADLSVPDCSDYIFTIIEYTDNEGHATGFNIANDAYKRAFANCETDARRIIDAIEARPSYETEDWFILITSDHGGFKKSHGSFTLQERMTFIAQNKYITLPPEGYELVLDENFDGDELNTDVWYYRANGERRSGFNAPSQTSLGGGNLRIKQEYRSEGEYGEGWYAGMIATKEKYNKGYFEIRCRCNETENGGFWSAFWLQADNPYDPKISKGGVGGAEIDIVEAFRNAKGAPQPEGNIHCAGKKRRFGEPPKKEGKLDSKGVYEKEMPDCYERFHTYSLLWDDEFYTFYVDGVEVAKSDWADGVSQVPEEVIVSLELSDTPPEDRSVTSEFTVDYVKIYQKK